MKHLLSGVAIVAVLAITVPAMAQRTGPGPGAATTTGPGVNPPGGPGPSSPLSNLPAGSPGIPGAPTPAQAPAYTGFPGPSGAPPETTSATPPMHRHAHHPHGTMAMHTKHGARTELAGSSADQLNQEELNRLRAGNLSNPPPMPPAH